MLISPSYVQSRELTIIIIVVGLIDAAPFCLRIIF